MQPFDYTRPSSVDEALALMHGQQGVQRPLAGGTDLLTLLKAGLDAPQRLIDIKRLDGLSDAVEDDGAGVTLGALCTLADIERHPLLAERYPLLGQAAGSAATPQLRNRATLGGNLLQRPRCWYFRNPQLTCWLKGGDDCPAEHGRNSHHALFGADHCCAVHPSDLAGALLALDAEISVRGSGTHRRLPLADFLAAPTPERRRETTLAQGELVTAIHLPPPVGRGVYLKAMARQSWAFALVGVAAVVGCEGSRVSAARLVLTGVANVPWRLTAVEQLLLERDAGAVTIDRALRLAAADARPLAENGYKVALLQGLLKQALRHTLPSVEEQNA